MEVRKANCERVGVGMLFGELDADFFGVIPIECVWHELLWFPQKENPRWRPAGACYKTRSRRIAGGTLVVSFLGVILIPLGNFDDEILRAIRDALAAEARLRRDAGSFIELVELGIGRLVAAFQPFVNDHMARGAGADAAARVV